MSSIMEAFAWANASLFCADDIQPVGAADDAWHSATYVDEEDTAPGRLKLHP